MKAQVNVRRSQYNGACQITAARPQSLFKQTLGLQIVQNDSCVAVHDSPYYPFIPSDSPRVQQASGQPSERYVSVVCHFRRWDVQMAKVFRAVGLGIGNLIWGVICTCIQCRCIDMVRHMV